MKKKNVARIAVVVGVIMLIPLLGNMLSDEWSWEVSEFVIMAILMFGTGLVLDVVARKISNPRYRVLA